MLKKCLALILVLLLPLILLSGCGDINDEEIYAKMIDALEEANSYRFTMDIRQNISMPGMPGMDMDITSNGEVTENPMTAYMEMSIKTSDFDMDTVSYMVDNLIYMYIPEMGWLWMDMTDDIALMDNMMASEYVYLLEHLDKSRIKFSLDGNSFILTLEDEDGDYMNAMMEKYMAEGGMDMAGLEDMAMFIDSIDFSDIKYKLIVDAKTFLPSQVELSMKVDISLLGETASMTQGSIIKMKDYGKVQTIVVPQDVIDSAISFDELYNF